MTFSEIPGLAEVKALLTEAVRSHHSPHAQLFAGAPGALNLPMAIAFATYLHCENRGEDACGTCPACSKNLKYIHPDTHFVFPVSNVKADKDEERFRAEIMKSWRAFLTEHPFGDIDDWTNYYGGEDKQAIISRDGSREIIKTLSMKPFESKYKVMIIWQPEMMHPAAANGILKILEEPASHTYFILVTDAADKLLPTIVSRTQIVTIPLLTDDALGDWLNGRGLADKDRVARVLQLADGNLNLSLKLLEGEENNNTQLFVDWMRACWSREYAALVEMAEGYHAMDKLSQKNLLAYSLNMIREALLYRCGATTINRAQGEELTFAQRFSGVMDVEKIEKSFRLINDASYHLERNGSAKMIFLDLSLQIANIFKTDP